MKEKMRPTSKQLKTFCIRAPHYDILLVLFRERRPLSLRRLAKELDISMTACCRAVRELKGKELLLQFDEDLHDGRVRLSPGGRALLVAALAFVERAA